MKNARDRVDAIIRCRDGFSIGDDKVEARPPLKVAPCVPDIGLRQIEAERRKPWPGLLDQIEGAASATAEIDQPQGALIVPGEDLEKLRQHLAPHRIGGALKQHLNLRVVTVSRGVGHPAARLKMEILQVVVVLVPYKG
jgi:hypothetical protein